VDEKFFSRESQQQRTGKAGKMKRKERVWEILKGLWKLLRPLHGSTSAAGIRTRRDHREQELQKAAEVKADKRYLKVAVARYLTKGEGSEEFRWTKDRSFRSVMCLERQ